MRHFLLLCTLLLPFISLSQTTKTDYDYYDNGQVHWKGKMVLIGNAYSPIGLWQYWYEDGSLKLETWDDGKSKTKYVNMFLPSREQILKNGYGTMYEVWPGGGQEADSTIYEIKDSLKQGFAKIYRVYKGGRYFFIMNGQYDHNSEETGKWIFRDTVIGEASEIYYLNGKKNGPYKRFYLNGAVRDSGEYRDDYEEGEWKNFTEIGSLKRQCNYKMGKLIGSYKEFYPDGNLKIEGTYRQAKGTIRVQSIGANSGIRRVYNKVVPNKEYKTGIWKYYDRQGNISRTENYR